MVRVCKALYNYTAIHLIHSMLRIGNEIGWFIAAVRAEYKQQNVRCLVTRGGHAHLDPDVGGSGEYQSVVVTLDHAHFWTVLGRLQVEAAFASYTVPALEGRQTKGISMGAERCKFQLRSTFQ